MPPVYRGPFGKPQAERLLWRAGFGPRRGEAERLAKLGLHGAVDAITRPGRDRLKGPRPHDGNASARLMPRQNRLFRRLGLGSFHTLLLEVTHDPAMLLWLSGVENTKDSPNENYARELMELFTLGAGRGAYSERDVREQARALTGWRNSWDDNLGPVRFGYEKRRHDAGTKRIFGKRGAFDWRDSCRLCVHHRLHPSFFVTKLWSYFIPVPPKP